MQIELKSKENMRDSWIMMYLCYMLINSVRHENTCVQTDKKIKRNVFSFQLSYHNVRFNSQCEFKILLVCTML